MAPNKCTFHHNHVRAYLDDKSRHSHLKYEVSMKNKQRRRIPQARWAVAGGSVLVGEDVGVRWDWLWRRRSRVRRMEYEWKMAIKAARPVG